jgi:hypothetical protein
MDIVKVIPQHKKLDALVNILMLGSLGVLALAALSTSTSSYLEYRRQGI